VKFPEKIGRSFALLFLVAAMWTVSACGNTQADPSEDGVIQVAATTGMVADIVREVGGDRVRVTSLMGPGVDPHLYKATHGDMVKLDRAELIFYNGLHLEGKMTKIFERMGRIKPVVPVAETIDPKRLIRTEDGQPDPHVWFDVRLWITAVETVRDQLIQADPERKADYEARAAAYIKELEELDRYVREQIASIPEKRRVLVTAHDAFSYFGRAYDIEVVGLQGINTASEYGLRDVQQLVNLLTERKIKAVFVESSVPKRSIEAVVKGSSEKGHRVRIGGELFSDALGEAGTPEGTYVGMIRHNVDAIVSALK
jgi:manganese/zinc/iron transport system substrate-binding protein